MFTSDYILETRSSSSTPSLKKQDDMLFEFLNSSNPVPAKGHIRSLSGPKTSTPRRPTDTSLKGSSKELPMVGNNIDSQSVDPAIGLDSKLGLESDAVSQHTQKQEKEEVESVPNGSLKMKEPPEPERVVDDHLSNLELENKLLKNEMHSLNQELASTLNKLKDQQEETEKYRKRYENRRNQQNDDYERLRKDYEDQKNDLNEALKAKDSQLAVLRVRIDDVDAKLAEKTRVLQEVQEHNDEIIKDHSDATGIQSVALDNLRSKLEETELSLRLTIQEKDDLKQDLMASENKLLSQQQAYAESLKQFQSKHHNDKDKYREYEIQLKDSQNSCEALQQELTDYKEKAARILQAKEKLIMSLKQGNSSSNLPPMLISELEESKHERDLLKEELQRKKFALNQLQAEYNDIELNHTSMTNEYLEKIEILESNIQNETMKRRNAEDDMKRYMQELNYTREDMQKVKKAQIAQNQENESEIKHLQRQLSAKKTTSASHQELENRIRTLTDNLIQKQTIVETLSTEKNSLVLQLERLEKQYLDVQSSLIKRKKETSADDPEDPGSGSQLQPMASIMPPQITRNLRWKKTVNDIDKFSVRLGVFLRRYPIARLIVIAYMILLHLWVTLVLLTYTPEVHGYDKSPRS